MARLNPAGQWLVCMFLAVLGGCSWMDAPPVEVPGDPHVTLTLQVALDANRNLFGRPSPVVVRVFQLAQSRVFEQASFSQLTTEPEKSLHADFLGEEVLVLRPGEQYRYHFIPQPHMRDIAVMVEFRDIDNSRWRVVSPVDQPKTPEVFVSIARNTVEFTTPKPLEQPRNE